MVVRGGRFVAKHSKINFALLDSEGASISVKLQA